MLPIDAGRPASAATVREPQRDDRAGSAIFNSPTTTTDPAATAHNNHSAYLLQQLRCAALRARLLACEIDRVGVALRAGWIDADVALEWLHDECPDAFAYLRPTPPHGGAP
jgi:hypothetical protein